MRLPTITLCVIFLWAAPLQARAYPKDGQAVRKSVRSFVQEFYAWYVPIALRDNPVPASDIALKQKPSAFSQELFSALKEDSEAQAKAKGYIVGIDFDPFLACQDPCEKYEAGGVAKKGKVYRVDIYGICSGQNHKRLFVVAELARSHGSWVFVNFRYPDVHDNLLSILRRLRRARQEDIR